MTDVTKLVVKSREISLKHRAICYHLESITNKKIDSKMLEQLNTALEKGDEDAIINIVKSIKNKKTVRELQLEAKRLGITYVNKKDKNQLLELINAKTKANSLLKNNK